MTYTGGAIICVLQTPLVSLNSSFSLPLFYFIFELEVTVFSYRSVLRFFRGGFSLQNSKKGRVNVHLEQSIFADSDVRAQKLKRIITLKKLYFDAF